jgi:hypothetical protein
MRKGILETSGHDGWKEWPRIPLGAGCLSSEGADILRSDLTDDRCRRERQSQTFLHLREDSGKGRSTSAPRSSATHKSCNSACRDLSVVTRPSACRVGDQACRGDGSFSRGRRRFSSFSEQCLPNNLGPELMTNHQKGRSREDPRPGFNVRRVRMPSLASEQANLWVEQRRNRSPERGSDSRSELSAHNPNSAVGI